MDRYLELEQQLKSKSKKAFIPFVTIGDPNKDLSLKIIDLLVELGASALELGLPFSDPLADGPVIQMANIRALNSHVYTDEAFDIIHAIREKHPQIPIGLLSYTNLATGYGVESFFEKLAKIQVDSVLLADMPIEMMDWIKPHFEKSGVKQVLLAPPNADKVTLQEIAKRSQGYIYLVGRSGVTGTELKSNTDLEENINLLKKYAKVPIYQGFGISTVGDAKRVLKTPVDGFIIGSALVKIIEKYQ